MRRLIACCVTLVLSMMFLVACTPEPADNVDDNQQNSYEQQLEGYDNELYGTLLEYFNYYYSMNLWSFERIAEQLTSLDPASLEEKGYIAGRIDSMLDYNHLYSRVTEQRQSRLKEELLSEDMMTAIVSFNEAERAYLSALASYLDHSPLTLGDEFISQNADLKASLKSLNMQIHQLDEEKEQQYIAQLEATTSAITQLTGMINNS